MNNRLAPKQHWLKRFLLSQLTWELSIALGALVLGVSSSMRAFGSDPPQQQAGMLYAGGTGFLFFVCVGRAIASHFREKGNAQPHAMDGLLHLLHAILTGDYPTDPGLRIGIFVPTSDEEVCQLTNYAGVDPPFGVGRRRSSRSGIVGKSIRSGKAHFDKLPKNLSLIDFLVQEYGFQRDEAATMRQDAKSWAAVPVGEKSRVIAVLFVDSSDVNFFGNSNSVRRKVIERSVIGVAEFVSPG